MRVKRGRHITATAGVSVVTPDATDLGGFFQHDIVSPHLLQLNGRTNACKTSTDHHDFMHLCGVVVEFLHGASQLKAKWSLSICITEWVDARAALRWPCVRGSKRAK